MSDDPLLSEVIVPQPLGVTDERRGAGRQYGGEPRSSFVTVSHGVKNRTEGQKELQVRL